MPPGDFSIAALYAALDAQRVARGLSWQQVAREVSGRFDQSPATPVSPSTLRGLCTKGSVEGDGVLQMLSWLRRSAESFVPGSDATSTEYAEVAPRQILRFDAKALHAALDARRAERALTWTQVADEIGGIGAASLTRMAKGGRVVFPQVMRIIRWVGRPAATFTRASDW
jgi:uncharacterized protein YfiM (DUF2279 family)